MVNMCGMDLEASSLVAMESMKEDTLAVPVLPKCISESQSSSSSLSCGSACIGISVTDVNGGSRRTEVVEGV